MGGSVFWRVSFAFSFLVSVAGCQLISTLGNLRIVECDAWGERHQIRRELEVYAARRAYELTYSEAENIGNVYGIQLENDLGFINVGPYNQDLQAVFVPREGRSLGREEIARSARDLDEVITVLQHTCSD